jgi:hypothetical protein
VNFWSCFLPSTRAPLSSGFHGVKPQNLGSFSVTSTCNSHREAGLLAASWVPASHWSTQRYHLTRDKFYFEEKLCLLEKWKQSWKKARVSRHRWKNLEFRKSLNRCGFNSFFNRWGNWELDKWLVKNHVTRV